MSRLAVDAVHTGHSMSNVSYAAAQVGTNNFICSIDDRFNDDSFQLVGFRVDVASDASEAKLSRTTDFWAPLPREASWTLTPLSVLQSSVQLASARVQLVRKFCFYVTICFFVVPQTSSSPTRKSFAFAGPYLHGAEAEQLEEEYDTVQLSVCNNGQNMLLRIEYKAKVTRLKLEERTVTVLLSREAEVVNIVWDSATSSTFHGEGQLPLYTDHIQNQMSLQDIMLGSSPQGPCPKWQGRCYTKKVSA